MASTNFTLDLSQESLDVLKRFSEAVEELKSSNSRLVDAEERLRLIELLLLDTDLHSESKELRWTIDQIARKVFGPNYGAFVEMMNKKTAPGNQE